MKKEKLEALIERSGISKKAAGKLRKAYMQGDPKDSSEPASDKESQKAPKKKRVRSSGHGSPAPVQSLPSV